MAVTEEATVTEARLKEETDRLWRIVDMQTDALSHAFWAAVWLGLIAVAALVLALVK